jgi:serine/threonine protein kinase
MSTPTILETAFNRYSVGPQIGQGGASRVFQARDDSGDGYAVKLLNDGANTEKRKRFQNEIQFCTRSEHRHIVAVHDHGVYTENTTSLPFYVMSLYSCSLRALLNQTLPAAKALQFFGQILDGVEAAHLLGAVHRDLKPENLLYDAKNDIILVADFGIAAFREEELYTAVETADGSRLANFQYAAPEQRRRGQPVDRRADIYALGLILNELFTGEVPQGTEYRKIASASPDYAYLDDMVAWMIRQRPTDRPDTIANVKEKLIARGNLFIAQQRVSQARQSVIRETDIDDTLVAEPMRLVGFDYEDGTLIFKLSQAVNGRWQEAFRNFGSHSAVMGKGPENFELRGNEARIRTREHDIKDVVMYFKQWLPLVNRKYEELARFEHTQQIEQQRRRLQAEIERAEQRKRILDTLSTL